MILNMRAPRDNPRVFSISAAAAPVPARVLRLVPGDVPWHEGPVRSGFLGEWRCGVLSALPSGGRGVGTLLRPSSRAASCESPSVHGHHAFSRQVRSLGKVWVCIRQSMCTNFPRARRSCPQEACACRSGKEGVAAHHATSDGIVYGCILLRHLESGASEIWA